jgi:hypothetical protein
LGKEREREREGKGGGAEERVGAGGREGAGRKGEK